MGLLDKLGHTLFGIQPPSERLSQRCPFGPALLLAASDAEMQRKLATHVLICHGPNPVTICS